MVATTLDASCPITPLVPYLLNATAAEEWAETEANSFGSNFPVALVLTVGSLLLLFLGERLSRVALFLGGALVAFVVSMYVSNALLSAASADPTASCITMITVPVVLGLVGGALSLYFISLAFACFGFAAGAAVGQILYILVLYHVTTGISVLDHDLFYFITLLTLALPAAVLLARYREPLMIVATAALGAVGLVPGLAILAFSHIDSRFLWVTDATDANEHRGSPFVYGQALAVMLYFPLGVLFQRRTSPRKAAVVSEVQPYVVFQDGNRRHNFGSSSA